VQLSDAPPRRFDPIEGAHSQLVGNDRPRVGQLVVVQRSDAAFVDHRVS
jgi:hypothetical protein